MAYLRSEKLEHYFADMKRALHSIKCIKITIEVGNKANRETSYQHCIIKRVSYTAYWGLGMSHGYRGVQWHAQFHHDLSAISGSVLDGMQSSGHWMDLFLLWSACSRHYKCLLNDCATLGVLYLRIEHLSGPATAHQSVCELYCFNYEPYRVGSFFCRSYSLIGVYSRLLL